MAPAPPPPLPSMTDPSSSSSFSSDSSPPTALAKLSTTVYALPESFEFTIGQWVSSALSIFERALELWEKSRANDDGPGVERAYAELRRGAQIMQLIHKHPNYLSFSTASANKASNSPWRRLQAITMSEATFNAKNSMTAFLERREREWEMLQEMERDRKHLGGKAGRGGGGGGVDKSPTPSEEMDRFVSAYSNGGTSTPNSTSIPTPPPSSPPTVSSPRPLPSLATSSSGIQDPIAARLAALRSPNSPSFPSSSGAGVKPPPPPPKPPALRPGAGVATGGIGRGAPPPRSPSHYSASAFPSLEELEGQFSTTSMSDSTSSNNVPSRSAPPSSPRQTPLPRPLPIPGSSTSRRAADHSPSRNSAPTPSPTVSIPFTTELTPRTLFDYLHPASGNGDIERGRKLKVLLLDVREREEFEKGKIEVGAEGGGGVDGDTVCLEPVGLRDGISSSDLESQLALSPQSEESAFSLRNTYDLVIIYDVRSQSLPTSPPTSTTPLPQRALYNLTRAIYDNEFRKNLKRQPVLLKGGWEGWVREVGVAGGREGAEVAKKLNRAARVVPVKSGEGSGAGAVQAGLANGGALVNGLKSSAIGGGLPSTSGYYSPPTSGSSALGQSQAPSSYTPSTYTTSPSSSSTYLPSSHASATVSQASALLSPRLALPPSAAQRGQIGAFESLSSGLLNSSSGYGASAAGYGRPAYQQPSLYASGGSGNGFGSPSGMGGGGQSFGVGSSGSLGGGGTSGQGREGSPISYPSLVPKVPLSVSRPHASSLSSSSGGGGGIVPSGYYSPQQQQQQQQNGSTSSSTYGGSGSMSNGHSSIPPHPSRPAPPPPAPPALTRPPPAAPAPLRSNSSFSGYSLPLANHAGSSFSQVGGRRRVANLQFGENAWIGLTGLKNLGNTCYMNSTVQCLSATIPFARYFKEGGYKADINRVNPLGTKGALADAVSELLSVIWAQKFLFVSPITFRENICRWAPQFRGSDQHDAQEFLGFLLDGLHEDLNYIVDKPKPIEMGPEREKDLETLSVQVMSQREWDIYRRRDDSFVVQCFQGQLRNQLRCLTCGKTSTTYNTFMPLSLPVPSGRSLSKTTLLDCVQAFVKEETLDKDDKWNCPQCKVARKATKKLSLSRLPPILVIHLKRFSFHGPFSDKIETTVQYPLAGLDLTSFVPPPLPAHKGAPAPVKNYIYDLYGVTNHYGNLSSGHYTAYVRNHHEWNHIGDSKVTTVDASAVQSAKSAYILYFALRPQH